MTGAGSGTGMSAGMANGEHPARMRLVTLIAAGGTGTTGTGPSTGSTVTAGTTGAATGTGTTPGSMTPGSTTPGAGPGTMMSAGEPNTDCSATMRSVTPIAAGGTGMTRPGPSTGLTVTAGTTGAHGEHGLASSPSGPQGPTLGNAASCRTPAMNEPVRSSGLLYVKVSTLQTHATSHLLFRSVFFLSSNLSIFAPDFHYLIVYFPHFCALFNHNRYAILSYYNLA